MTKNIGTVTVTDGVANITLDTKDLTEGTYNIITRYPETNTQTEATNTTELNINPRPKIKVYTPCNMHLRPINQFTEEQLYCMSEIIQYMKDTNRSSINMWADETKTKRAALFALTSSQSVFTVKNSELAYTGMELVSAAGKVLQVDLEVYPNPYMDNGGGE